MQQETKACQCSKRRMICHTSVMKTMWMKLLADVAAQASFLQLEVTLRIHRLCVVQGTAAVDA